MRCLGALCPFSRISLILVLFLLAIPAACQRSPKSAPEVSTPTSIPLSSPATTPTATPQPPWEPDETLLAFGELLEEDGSLPLATALEILAGTGIPLPGIPPRTLPGENLGPVVHAAAIVVLAQQDRLPPDVVQAVEAAFFGDLEGTVEVLPEGDSSSAFLPVAYGFPSRHVSSRLARAEAAIRTYVPVIEQRSGLSLTIPLQVSVSTRAEGEIDGTASPVQEGDGVTGCRVTFYPPAFETQAELEVTAAHEIWHCLTFLYAGTGDTRQWLLEGQAEWVASEVATDPSPTAVWWRTWVLYPNYNLWIRSYDAIGLYAVAQGQGVDVFPRLISMYQQSNLEAISTLFGGLPPEQALLFIATSFLREPGYGPQWEIRGRGLPEDRANRPRIEVISGRIRGARLGQAVPFSTIPIEIEVNSPQEGEDILVLEATGPALTIGAVQFPSLSFQTFRAGDQMKFCVSRDSRECLCPDGSPPAGMSEPPPRLNDSRGIAAMGSLQGGGGTAILQGYFTSIEDLCLVGTWVADARALLAANMAPYGAAPQNCDGQMVLTFKQDGTFTYTADVTCTGNLSTGSLQVSSEGVFCTGNYVTEEGHFTILSSQCQGNLVIEGVPGMGPIRLPFPVENLYPLSQRVPYTIKAPGILTYTFVVPEDVSITQTWKRQPVPRESVP